MKKKRAKKVRSHQPSRVRRTNLDEHFLSVWSSHSFLAIAEMLRESTVERREGKEDEATVAQRSVLTPVCANFLVDFQI